MDLRVVGGQRYVIWLFLFDALEERDRRAEKKAVVSSTNPDWETEVEITPRSGSLSILPPREVDSRADIRVQIERIPDGLTVPVDFSFRTTDGEVDRLGCVSL
jgi:hypothetical protein